MNKHISIPVTTLPETNDRKRIFAAYQPPFLAMKEQNLEEKVLETPKSSRKEGGDVKRTRRDSPVPNGTKACIPDASLVDLSLLPILADAVLPDPKQTNVEPDDYLLQLTKALFGVDLKVQKGLELGEDYFKPITDAQLAAYTVEVLTLARDNNVQALKDLVTQKGPAVVNCVNRFGESLLNLACRRGFSKMAEFLLGEDVALDVKLKDDFGRTPLHDACWHPTPQLDICGRLIQREPSLLLVADKRGNTPFKYARGEDWPAWRQFLFDNRESLLSLMQPSTLKQFCQ